MCTHLWTIYTKICADICLRTLFVLRVSKNKAREKLWASRSSYCPRTKIYTCFRADRKERLLRLLSWKYFCNGRERNIYVQVTIYCEGRFSFQCSKQTQWTNKHVPFPVTNTKHYFIFLDIRIENWGISLREFHLGNITWGISSDISQFKLEYIRSCNVREQNYHGL